MLKTYIMIMSLDLDIDSDSVYVYQTGRKEVFTAGVSSLVLKQNPEKQYVVVFVSRSPVYHG